MVGLLMLTIPLRWDWAFGSAVMEALRELPDVWRDRQQERRVARWRGREVERFFRALEQDRRLRQ
jgi:hypothetical protein